MNSRQSSFEAIGTRWQIQVTYELPETEWQQLLNVIHTRIDSFDKTYSRFRNDSLVTTMAKQAGTFELPPDANQMLSFYEQLYRATSGNVTPLIGQVISDAGYDASYSLQPKAMQQPPTWDEIINYDKKTITLNQSALLDFGAAGKGYLVDIISDLLSDAGVSEYVINAGGDILQRTKSAESLLIGLENPLDTSEVIGVANIKNKSLCASSGSRRKWGNYHHIIDPHSLESPQDIIATWTVADDTMTADGLATALFFTSPTLLQQFNFSYAILRQDMSLEYDKHFPVKLYQESA